MPTSATNVPTLVGQALLQCSAVGLQAPEANANIIYFGDKNSQPFELRPEANAFLPVNNLRDIYIRGSSGDDVSIAVF